MQLPSVQRKRGVILSGPVRNPPRRRGDGPVSERSDSPRRLEAARRPGRSPPLAVGRLGRLRATRAQLRAGARQVGSDPDEVEHAFGSVGIGSEVEALARQLDEIAYRMYVSTSSRWTSQAVHHSVLSAVRS